MSDAKRSFCGDRAERWRRAEKRNAKRRAERARSFRRNQRRK